MKLVIDIPEEEYNKIEPLLNGETIKGGFNLFKALNIIKSGTPIPKGYGRLIDANEIQFENADFDTYGDYCRAFDAIDQADTIIEADAESEDKA